MSDLNKCKADNYDSLFMTYNITDKMFKDTIINLNSLSNVTNNKYSSYLNEK